MSIKKTSNVTDNTNDEHTVNYSAVSPVMDGRTPIYTNETVITRSNVVQVLNDVLQTHMSNRNDICFLHDYLRGRQPIRDRVKATRPEICNRIVINRANEIVTFKTANFIGEPLQYVSRGANKDVPAKIEKLNSFMMSENKASKDMRLAYWMFTCGVGYRLVLNDKQTPYFEANERRESYDEAPFEIYTLDPRNTFVIRRNDVTERVIAGVTFVFKDESTVVYSVYTENEVIRVEGTLLSAGRVVGEPERHNNGLVPLIEYPCNPLRMGAFEIVIELLDAINLTESNRLDGVEQFVQAIMVFENVEITSDKFKELKDKGALLISSRDGNQSKVYYLNEQLDQSQTQMLMEDLDNAWRQIVGMPSQGNANTSDSSNNGAIIMKNGWWNAESRSKETIGMFMESETEFLKNVLKICNDANAVDLHLSDVEMKFGRNSYQDLISKTQAFTTMISSGAPPLQAYTISGVVTDPESAAIMYEKYQNQKENDLIEQLNKNPRESMEFIESE